MEKAIYLFCLACSGEVPPLEGAGISGSERLFQEDFRDVTAVVCNVQLDEFVGSSADQRLQELAWVGPRALQHEQVIEEVMQYSPVLPARFGTLFSSRESLQGLLENNHSQIGQFLVHMRDKEEWAVKCILSRATAKQRLLSEKLSKLQKDLDSTPPGMRYFKERQVMAEVDKALSRWLAEVCNAVAEKLKVFSVDSKKRGLVQAPEDNSMEMVANWAFLVGRSVVQNFKAMVDKANRDHNDQGLFFRCSGPWPPYTFSPPLDTEPRS